MTEEQFIAAKRFFYFVYEELVGICIIFMMIAVAIAAGTWLITNFGDTGGFVWLGTTYVELLAFYPIYDRLRKSMRTHTRIE